MSKILYTGGPGYDTRGKTGVDPAGGGRGGVRLGDYVGQSFVVIGAIAAMLMAMAGWEPT